MAVGKHIEVDNRTLLLCHGSQELVVGIVGRPKTSTTAKLLHSRVICARQALDNLLTQLIDGEVECLRIVSRFIHAVHRAYGLAKLLSEPVIASTFFVKRARVTEFRI